MKRHATDLLRKFRKSVKRFFGSGTGAVVRSKAKLAVELLEDRQLMAASFLAPVEPSGSVNIQLVPLANVTAGAEEIVTFGMPFTRGSVSQSQLSQVRVLKNGAEIPAFVEQLTPWRSIDDPGIDGQSVRVARIQIPYTFAALAPETITVQWGGPARTLNRATMQDPRLEWHTVTSGTFVAADNVEEPDVLPVLPKSHMAKGMFDARTQPTASGVAETRDDPAVMDAMTFTGYTEFDYAQKNFFYTLINQNPGITIDYKTQPEPWLYDRSSAMYELYLRSGFATALREAIRATDFYADRVNASGFFTLRPGDPKYAYNEPLAYTFWLLGDNRMLAPISTVVSAHNGTPSRWNPNLSFWTERNVGYKLLANEIAYEVTGATTFKNNVQTIVNDLIWHQNGAGGQLPGNRIDGGLYHEGGQHDASEVGDPNVIIASSWMSALIVDPMVRAYGVWQNPQIADFIVRMGNFEKAASKTDANGQFGGTTRYPDYLMRADGTTENRSDTDVQHAMDVGAVAAWATYFAELRGTPDASLRQLANDLYATYDVGVNFWTRPGGTNFNVSPPRRYNWEYKNSPSFSWALTGSDAPDQPGTLQFNAASYSVNETQGSVTITVTRAGGSTGSVTVNYATSNGTATAGSDYTAASGTLTFADGETSKSFTVPIINDTAIENAETVTLTLSSPTGGAGLGSPASATLTIDSEDSSGQPVTVSFQQGVNGYNGTTDVNISTQYAQYTGGNGVTSITGTQLGVYETTGTSAYTVEGLIRFSDLGIPTGATVSGAALTLHVDTWSANPTLRGYYLLAPWSTVTGGELGWLHRGTGQDWAVPGARGQGTDLVGGNSFVLSGIIGNGGQTITVNLDPVIVQSWISNPNANQGILLVNESPGAIVRINASEHATAATRPKFSVTYTDGVPTPQPGSLQLSAAAYSVNENGGTATITITRTGGGDGSVTVNYATSNGTATAGSDYTAASGTLTFANGETSKSFTISIINDTLVEGNETVTITLSSATGGATLGSPATATLTIISDDATPQPGTLQFSAATYSVNENGGTATITITRTGGSDGSVTVNYATSNGTATAGSDYTAASGTLTFANGETSKSFTIPITNDTLVEGNETVNITLSSPTGGATLGSPATSTLTIVSDDVAQPGVLQFSLAAYSVNETQGTATITVTRTGGSNVAVSIDYATSNGTATAGADYTAASGTLSFGVGETNKTFTVPIINDTAIENAETVTLTLSNPTGGATLGSPASATLTINSDDSSGQPVTVTWQQGVNGYTGTTDASISTQYTQYTEGNGITSFTGTQLSVWETLGTGSYIMESLIRFSDLGIPTSAAVTGATLTLRVDTWTANPTLRGYYLLAPWSGTPGSNSSQLGWLHRGAGQDWASPGARGQGTDVVAGNSFVLSGIVGNGGQTITVNLSPVVVQSWIANPSANHGILLVNETPGAIVRINASEHATTATRPKLSITYTDGGATPQPGTLQFSNATYAVNESGATATITVTRTGGSDGSVTVNYATSNGTATAGSDYTAASGTLTFAAGETSKTFTVPIANDTAFEGNETINLTLSSPTGGATLGSQTTAVLTIQDDDVSGQPGSLQFNAGSYSLTENGGTLTVTVTRTGGTSGIVSVQYATSNGTATAGSDYTAASGTLTFANGEASKTFTVAVLDDGAVEGNETLTLTLSNPSSGATLGSPASATFSVVDNDSSPGVVLPAGFTQSVVATGISSGTALAVAPDGRIFVLEQGGAVRVIKNGALLTAPAFTVQTVAESERGLLGITFDPNFAANGFVYVYYTVGGPSPSPAHNRVSRFTLSGDLAVPGSETILLDLPNTTYRIHNGGALKFGSDGMLYIAVGNDVEWNNAQDLTKPFGKILRINADGTIPTDNPFYNQTTGVNRAIWARGLRNPYTFDVQTGTGLMYINDVGESSWEEINQGTAGANYGWPNSEGYTTNPQYQSPVYAYGHGGGVHQGFAIVGGAFYNPATATFPAQYAGKYFFMDYVNGWIDYVDPSAPNPKTPTNFASNIPTRYDGGPVDLEVGTDGALYYLNRLGGGVFKIQYSAAAQAPSITQHPASQTVTQGQPVTFTVAASSALPISYQWQKMDSGTTTWVNITGATSASFTIGGTAAADNGDQFRCVVSNSAGSTNSNAATLTVTTNTAPSPTIAAPAAGALYNAGDTIAFNGSATDAEQGTLPASSLSWWVVFHHDTHTHPFLGSEASPYVSGAASGSFAIPTSGEVAANQWYRIHLKATDAGGLSTIVVRDVNPRVSTFTLATNNAGLSLTLDGQPVASSTAIQGVVGMVRTLGAPSGQVVGGKTYNFVSWSDGGAQTHTITTPASNTTYTATFQEAPAPVGTFTNVTASSGVGAIVTQKYQQTPDWWLSGQHLVDLDNDGDLDLFLSNHGGGSVVALNNGNGVFTRLTTGSFPDSEIHQMVDINEDGKVDVSMTFQDGGGRWWINNSTPGAVNFTATSVTRGTNTARAQVMMDFNGDGKVDWLRSAPPGLVVDFGNGAGGFTAGSLAFTIPGTTSNENANFLPADFDDDGDIDLLVLTGGGYDGTLGKTAYWRNNGNQTFTDVTSSSGIPANATLAKGIGDYDHDGDTDFIAIENKSMPPAIYLNSGQGVFTKKAGAISGVSSGTMDYSAWGTAISTDFDNDGIADIIMNGKYYLKVLRGTGGGNFTYMNTAWGIADLAASAVDDGLCFGDFDSDGDLDIIGYSQIWPTGTLNVYRNDLAAKNWLNIRPVGLAGVKGAAGAKISIFAAGTSQLLWYEQVATYDFQVATSYYGYGETERHFGLGTRATVDVVVEFAGPGRVTRVNNVAANQMVRVLESAGSVPAMAATAAADVVFDSMAATAQLSNRDLQRMGRAAIARLVAAGADRAQLAGVRFVLADLPDGMLGRQTGGLIEIDRNAAGYGWFVDATPRTDSEFSGATRPSGIDLLSHELGHVLGLAHDDPGMSETLAPGTRLVAAAKGEGKKDR